MRPDYVSDFEPQNCYLFITLMPANLNQICGLYVLSFMSMGSLVWISCLLSCPSALCVAKNWLSGAWARQAPLLVVPQTSSVQFSSLRAGRSVAFSQTGSFDSNQAPWKVVLISCFRRCWRNVRYWWRIFVLSFVVRADGVGRPQCSPTCQLSWQL